MIVPVKSIIKGSNTNISPLIHPLDQPYLLNGCTNTWKIGRITKDTGYELVAAQIQDNKSIKGLFDFRQVPGTEKMLATVDDSTSDDTQLFYRANGAGSWTEIAAAKTAWVNFAGIDVEMESFIGYCFFVGYGETDEFLPVGSLTGTTFSTSTNVTSMPQGKFVKRFNGKLYVANCSISATRYPYRIYYSSFPTAGAITWTQATDFLDVDYSDEITGMEQAWRKLIVWTEKKTWMWDGSSWNDPWETGCIAHRTIKRHGAYLFWCNTDGVWVSTGGQPQNIVGEVYDIFKAANPKNMFAEIVDEQYWLYLGDVTVGDVSFSNLAIIFDISKSIWWVREFADTMTIFSSYTDVSTGDVRLYMGTSDGQVLNKGKYTDSTLLKADIDQDISSTFELAPFHLDSIDKFKRLNRVIAYADRPGGIKLKARIVDRTARALTPYVPLGELKQFEESFDVDVPGGVILQIMGSETSQNQYWSFLGYAMDVELQGNIPVNAYR